MKDKVVNAYKNQDQQPGNWRIDLHELRIHVAMIVHYMQQSMMLRTSHIRLAASRLVNQRLV